MFGRPFERFAAACAFAVAAGALAYAIVFVIILNTNSKTVAMIESLLLLVGGVLSSAVLIAVYGRVRETDAGLALWGLVLGVTGAFGSAIHGGWDLAIQAHDPKTPRGDLPNAIDPRGLLTFGFTALAILVFSWLILKGGARLPLRLGTLGIVAGVLLVAVYLGRLIIFDPENPFLLGTAALSGFLVNPAWFLWLGLALRTEPTVDLRGVERQASVRT